MPKRNPRQIQLAAIAAAAAEELEVRDVVVLVRAANQGIELGLSPQCKAHRTMIGDAVLDYDGLLERAGIKEKES